jgi:photosystem II stability/assembly factor-like uncharacterized protein
VDAANPARLYAGVVNDKSYGGVFVSSDGGTLWDHIGEGLDGRDVFALGQSPDGTVLAGTNHGIFLMEGGTADAPLIHWTPRNTIKNVEIKWSTVLLKGKKVTIETKATPPARELEGRVFALDLSGDAWLAATTAGLLTSQDHGATWQGGLVKGSADFRTVAAHGAIMAAALSDRLVISNDAGQNWSWSPLPKSITRIDRVAFSADGALWLGGREGVNLTRDKGRTWLWIVGLPFRDVGDLYYDANLGRMLVSSRGSDLVYAIDPAKLSWKWAQTGWKVSLIRAAAGRLVAASVYDGVVVEPRTVAAASALR